MFKPAWLIIGEMRPSLDKGRLHGARLREPLALLGALCSLVTFACSNSASDTGGGAGSAASPVTAGSGGGVVAHGGGAGSNAGAENVGGSIGGTAGGADAGAGVSPSAGGTAGSASAGMGDGSANGGTASSGSAGASNYPTPLTAHLRIGSHDPSMIQVASRYYLFVTGGLLNVRSSTNFSSWTSIGNIFPAPPAWIATELGQTITDLWAPDISYFNGAYHVYYAGSVFGSNHSVIGLATSSTLDPAATGYEWVDQGLVIESNKKAGADDWNAIDPNLALDENGQPWLVFGSFWSGIKLRQIDAATGKLATGDSTLYALANNSSIEAPSIVAHNGYYYLFVSYGACCKGVNSTYSTMVGRGTTITGPYSNRAGAAMAKGNAETMLTTTGRYIGPGGGTAFRDGDLYYYAYHYYDGEANGTSYLMLRPIQWGADDWPLFGAPLWQ